MLPINGLLLAHERRILHGLPKGEIHVILWALILRRGLGDGTAGAAGWQNFSWQLD